MTLFVLGSRLFLIQLEIHTPTRIDLQEFILCNVPVATGQFHYRGAAFSSQFKSKIDNILAKAEVLRINLNIDGAPVGSRSHTHTSHSETSRLLTSSLSLGVPVPRVTQCIRGV